MLVHMQAAGRISIRIDGAKFNSVQFSPENMGKCTIQTLTTGLIEISDANQHFLWSVEFEREPLSIMTIVASTDSRSELHFSYLPDGSEKHVSPGQSNVNVYTSFAVIFERNLFIG